MRVIAGSARRIQLKTVPGNSVRPTTDRIKETLFNILQPLIYEASFLDLFSGSGGIGIEALSRGASEAVFVENGREAVKCIAANLDAVRLTDKARLIERDALSAIRLLDGREAFSIIYMDPPYHGGFEEPVLEALAGSSLVDSDTLVIIEADLQTELPFISRLGFYIDRDKRYKTSRHYFLKYNIQGNG